MFHVEMKQKKTVNALPQRCLEWLVTSRMNFINEMKEGKPLRYFSAHLPVMATWPASMCNGGNGGNDDVVDTGYPVNMTVKGIGLIPRDELLTSFTEMFETITVSSRTKPHMESITERVGAINKLYGDIGNFDPSVLGGLEIFGGKTLDNLNENSNASLLYVGMHQADGASAGGGMGVSYISFQVNGHIEILNKNNPYYRFLLASRKLFEFDKFHIFQPDYPFGYLIKIKEVLDKSPWSKASTGH
ncbi:hypothetical protein [Candidatus Magnetominusculus xianensis]|uniref:Uncharacterized protein n=1 Tax=Candidatus Magnetominusculus xianensis TaxID=1748249 RepID=A0ABR5SBA2_9BACT|nr:hypothetical protein [Candidatus Magnetominusculus xianensis]KWT76814.1 hypothetical protein ASN18_3080 [Candidatus Magnetominusculus xianensis]MBF0402680.1 hypothetical protein [Nitrospirota bacterium]